MFRCQPFSSAHFSVCEHSLFALIDDQGVAVPSILFVRAGSVIQDLTSTNDIANWQTGLAFTVGGAVLLLPILLKEKLKKYD